jgi:hypothetical protein
MVTAMPVTADRPGPYAPPSAVIEVVERHRTKGIPNPITSEVLERAGVSPSLIPRTLQTLQTLDLIGDNGAHSDVLEGLRRAPEGEYKQRLVQWLDAAYADARQFVDPATDDEVAVRDAFRNYNPFGQQSRMVTLFIGLYEHAGVVEKKADTPRAAATRKPPTHRALSPRTVQKLKANKDKADHEVIVVPHHGKLPSALSGLLADLPTMADGWTKDERDRFVVTFNAVLDFCYPAGIAPKRDNRVLEEESDQ